MRSPARLGRFHMAQDDKRSALKLKEAIRAGSMLGPMANWKPLASAVSGNTFIELLARTGKWQCDEFIRLGVPIGHFERLALKISPNGLVRQQDETGFAFCQRVFTRRPAWNKSLDEALRPMGRPPCQPELQQLSGKAGSNLELDSWKPMPFAVHGNAFVGMPRGTAEALRREFIRHGLPIGHFEQLALKISPNGLERHQDETGVRFC